MFDKLKAALKLVLPKRQEQKEKWSCYRIKNVKN
jgi:hypothetical protein